MFTRPARSAAAMLAFAWVATASPILAQSDGVVLTASRSSSSVLLNWSGGVAPFDVYRSINPAALFAPGAQITETSNPSWLDTPPAGTLWFYGIKTAPDSARIGIARSAADGPVNVPITGSIVTYTKPAIGIDPAGFFIQDSQPGPALFVAIDPATLSPPPAVGDKVGFTITSMGTLSGLREALTLSSFAQISTGNPIAGLVQDVSTLDYSSSANLDATDSELISVTGTLAQAFQSQGAGFVGAPLDTTGDDAGTNLVFRTTPSVVDAEDLVPNCMIHLTSTPLWRFNAIAQPMALNASEVTPSTCPAPRVTRALALSASTVEVDFDRRIDPASVNPSGSQFVFTGGLTASAASVSVRHVTLTTSTQSPGAPYNVTVSGTVKDTLGSGVDPTATSAAFTGYVTPAVLLLNEVNPSITGSKDLVEILVVIGGSTGGVTLEQGIGTPTVLATLPEMPVASGDIIVVHMAPGATEGPASETTGKAQYANALYSNNYDSAWDVNGGATGIAFSDRVILLRRPTGQIADAVPFVLPAGSAVTGFPPDLQSIQSVGQWLPADCGGVVCTNSTVPSAKDVSVSWAGVGTSPVGFSVQRRPVGDTNTQSDWKAASAPSFGLPNSP